MSRKELSELLEDWTDTDWAAFYLAYVLGIMPDIEVETFTVKYKWVFWSSTPTGHMLYDTIRAMVTHGFLEEDEDTEMVRLNPNWSLEGQ